MAFKIENTGCKVRNNFVMAFQKIYKNAKKSINVFSKNVLLRF